MGTQLKLGVNEIDWLVQGGANNMLLRLGAVDFWQSHSTMPMKPMREQMPVEIGNGQTYLIIVQGDRVIDYTWAMMPHIEFVKRSVGKLPDGAWVGTVSKIDGEIAVISSKTFLRCANARARVGREDGEVGVSVIE